MVAEELEPTLVVKELLDPDRPLPVPEGASRLLRLLWPYIMPPLARLRVFTTIGLLPPKVREKLGLAWTDRDERRMRLLGRVIAAVVPRLPERLRYLPVARQARRAVRRGESPTPTESQRTEGKVG
ncbi:oxygenase MpaB family protein [Salinactinospora qingdaonensis]|uniref:ER-bound oxygenase mpaB/mpaB'/Rubber oxygenase catalytic domain-containing protein n=1 Tax=Salinactinospora qingdaonensis TaxID=702744 RepID=A0ABP7G6C5_9ACTN